MSSIAEVSSPTNPAIQHKQTLEGFALARDTLKKLSLTPHEIDTHGFPCIPGNTNLDQRYERKKGIDQYTAHFYATNLQLKEKFKESAIDNLNQILEKISAFNPSIFVNQPLSYIIKLNVLKSPCVLALMHSDPLITLNLITGQGCGLYSSDITVKKGALTMLIVLAKIAEHSIQSAENIKENLTDNLLTISLIREILYKQNESSNELKIPWHIQAIENELEKTEANALEKCKTLPKSQNEVQEQIQEENEEEIKYQEEPEKETVKIDSLNFLD